MIATLSRGHNRRAGQRRDRDMFGKTDFILDVLRRVGVTEEQLASIERANQRS
jgi:hypothetical protein